MCVYVHACVPLRAISNCYPEPQIMANKLPQAYDLLTSSLYHLHPEATAIADDIHHRVAPNRKNL